MVASTPPTNIHDPSWDNDFFHCCSPAGLCFLTACCPCITFGKTQHQMSHSSLKDYSCCNSSVSIYFTCWILIYRMLIYSVLSLRSLLIVAFNGFPPFLATILHCPGRLQRQPDVKHHKVPLNSLCNT